MNAPADYVPCGGYLIDPRILRALAEAAAELQRRREEGESR